MIKTYLPVPPTLRNQPKNRPVIIVTRRLKAMELRKGGLSLEAIARECGVSMRTTQKDLQYCLKELVEMTAHETDEYRQLELERLDKMLEICMNQIEANGTGVLWAIDRALLIADRRAKFLGLDKPMALIVAGDKDNPLEIEHKHSIDDALMNRMNKLAGLATAEEDRIAASEVLEGEFKELPAP